MDPDLLKCRRVETKILVVDGEEYLVEIMREKLELEGFLTEGAGNGVEALERLSTFHADLAISGIRMPVMEGVPLLRRCLEWAPLWDAWNSPSLAVEPEQHQDSMPTVLAAKVQPHKLVSDGARQAIRRVTASSVSYQALSIPLL